MALPDREFIRPKEAPDFFGVSRATLYRWADRGHITCYKRGGLRFFSIVEVRNYIQGHATPAE